MEKVIKEIVGRSVKECSPRNNYFNYLSYMGFWSKIGGSFAFCPKEVKGVKGNFKHM